MKRRQFIATSGLSIGAILLSNRLPASDYATSAFNLPDRLSAMVNGKWVELSSKAQQHWQYNNINVELINTNGNIVVYIEAPGCILNSVVLHWKIPGTISALMNDHWERTYGDASWHPPLETEILPWYFMEITGKTTNGFGVKTGASAFCSWQVKIKELSLTIDTCSGGNGVLLGDRKLKAAEVVTLKGRMNESPFNVTRRFTRIMCDKVKMPKQPVYGINDWYFTYGNNSEKLILEHTQLMAPLADGLTNRPFSVIDAGWFIGPPSMQNDCCWGDRMDIANKKFGDMSRSAANIIRAGMRPGIWTRPLCGSYKDSSTLMLPLIKGREQAKPVLDPSIPENLERIKTYFKIYNEWGYEMVKFDFTTFDITGKWGFEMLKTENLTTPGWNMNDRGKTNAEIIHQLYATIRESAGETYIIGCNTISHLSAGLFELNRIGDDTSGNEWERTRKMGVNTLAFRCVQHGHFYATDADCVGLTSKVPWSKNKQWMELLAKSGTPLFISAQPDATGANQKQTIKDCFSMASKDLPVGEPLDWMKNPFPEKWKLNGVVENFKWD